MFNSLTPNKAFSALLDGMANHVKWLDTFCVPRAILCVESCGQFFANRSGFAVRSHRAFGYYAPDWAQSHIRYLVEKRLQENGLDRSSPMIIEDIDRRAFYRDALAAFKVVSGKTPAKFDRDFLYLCRRGVPEPLSGLLFRARYRLSSLDPFFRELSSTVRQSGGPDAFVQDFNRAYSESPALTIACMSSGIALDVNCFQQLKKKLSDNGVGRRTFAWISRQSMDWALLAAGSVGFPLAGRYRLRSAVLRRPKLSDALLTEPIRPNVVRYIHSMPAKHLDFSKAGQVHDYIFHSIPADPDDPLGFYRQHVSVPKNVSYQTLVARSDAWHEEVLRAREQEIHAPFPAPVADVDFPANWRGVEELEWIRTPQRLFEEGQNQRHCVSSFAKRCARGEYMVFSFLVKEERHTAGFGLSDGCWRLDQVKRRMNRDALPSGKSFCSALASELNRRQAAIEPPAQKAA